MPQRIVPLRHWGQWLSAVAVALVTVLLVVAFASSPNIQWDVVGDYLFSGEILGGLGITLVLTVLCMVVGSVTGLALALMNLSNNRVMVWLANAYLFIFRGVPTLVQLVFWFNLALVLPTVSIGVPFTDLQLVEGSTNSLITPFVAAVVGLGLAEAAYVSEIFRGGLLSVDRGQTEAAASLGMPPGLVTRRIVLPQAMRFVIPPMGNELNAMVKGTSLVAIIGTTEMFVRAQNIYHLNYAVVELLLVVSFWYLVVTAILMRFQAVIERRFGRGFGQSPASVKAQRRSVLWRR